MRTIDDLRETVQAGLPLSALDHVADYIAESRRDASRIKDWIVSWASRYRRKRLKAAKSERLERIARVVALAEHVWESKHDAHEFLTTPQPRLADRAPLELARSELGARQLEDLLMQLEYSLPA
ncbi:MAG: DUF2384 domain-containing protein [Gemmatimonadota bacterium]|nr:MAG: DUF2384 domain-containing protein [Gemmatimonadota bacterium]